jgi:integrase
MGVKIRISHGKIFLDIYFAGKRKWESTGLSVSPVPRQQKEVMRLAEIIRSKRETQIISERYNILDPIPGKETLHSYISKYAKNTVRTDPVRSSIKHLEKYPGGKNIRISEITPNWVENYRSYLIHDCGIGKTSASNYFNALRRVLNKAVRENIIPKSPASTIKPIKKQDPKRIFLSENELQNLGKTPPPKGRRNANNEIKKAFIFSCYTGLRISDIRTLKWKHISHTERETVTGTITETKIKKYQKKTDGYLDVPITNDAWELLNYENNPPESPVFPSLAASRYNYDITLRKWGESSGLNENLSWHIARRTFAMRLLESGTDIYTISRLLGHTNIITTQKYLKTSYYLENNAVLNIKEIEISDSKSDPPLSPDPNPPCNDSDT